MTIDRLSHLQAEVEGYYEQLAGKESALRTIEESEKVRIEQQFLSYQDFYPMKWNWIQKGYYDGYFQLFLNWL